MKIIEEYIQYLKTTKNLSDKTLRAYTIDIKQFIRIVPIIFNQIFVLMWIIYLIL